MTYRFYILPGGDGRNDYGWFNWLKKELEDRGHEATICEEYIMSPEKRAEVFVREYSLDERSIIVGHSSGGPAAIKWIENVDQNIYGLLLVDPGTKLELLAPWEKDNDMRISFLECWDWQMDFSKVRSQIKRRIILADKNLCLRIQGKEEGLLEYSRELDTTLTRLKPEKQHFCAEQEPSVLTRAIELCGATEKI